MDLALELGVPAEQLAAQMSEREFVWWAKRAQRQWLPSRRIEWMLAQVAHMIAVTMGGAKDVSVSDYMLRLEPEDEADAPADVDAARAFFAFNPIKKGG